MNQFLYLIPALTVLTGAMVLMFMSMYKRFVVKDFIIVSSIFLFIALGFTVADLGNSYSNQPYEHFLNNVLTFDSFSNFFNILLIAGTLLTLLIVLLSSLGVVFSSIGGVTVVSTVAIESASIVS